MDAVCDAVIRFSQRLALGFNMDPDSGNVDVSVEIIDDEAVKHIITGYVVWDE